MIESSSKRQLDIKELRMQTMPQLVPVSELRYNHREVFRKLQSGVILLAQRSKPAAVLVSVEEWDRRARRLIELEGLLEAKQALERVDAGLASTTTLDELKQQLIKHKSIYGSPVAN
jgi:prevent-host-death family protein